MHRQDLGSLHTLLVSRQISGSLLHTISAPRQGLQKNCYGEGELGMFHAFKSCRLREHLTSARAIAKCSLCTGVPFLAISLAHCQICRSIRKCSLCTGVPFMVISLGICRFQDLYQSVPYRGVPYPRGEGRYCIPVSTTRGENPTRGEKHRRISWEIFPP